MAATENIMDESILEDVRVACNVDENDDGFDRQLIPLINSQLMIAHEFGVGYNGFRVTGDGETWQDLLGNRGGDLAAIKTWLGFSVLLLFDPPDNGTVLKSYQDQVQKMEYLLREKSCREGYVKEYVPEQAAFYDDLYDLD